MPLLPATSRDHSAGHAACNAMRATPVAYLPQQFGRRLALQRARGYQFAAVESLLMVALASSVDLAIGYGYNTAFGMIARGQQRRPCYSAAS